MVSPLEAAYPTMPAAVTPAMASFGFALIHVAARPSALEYQLCDTTLPSTLTSLLAALATAVVVATSAAAAAPPTTVGCNAFAATTAPPSTAVAPAALAPARAPASAAAAAADFAAVVAAASAAAEVAAFAPANPAASAAPSPTFPKKLKMPMLQNIHIIMTMEFAPAFFLSLLAFAAVFMSYLALQKQKDSTSTAQTTAVTSTQASSASAAAAAATLTPVAAQPSTATTQPTQTVNAPVDGPSQDLIAQLSSKYGNQVVSVAGMVAKSLATSMVDRYIAKAVGRNLVTSAIRDTAKAIGKTAGNTALKAMGKVGSTALRGCARFAEALDLGPAGVAMLGFDVLTLGLDIADPLGFNQMLTQSAMAKTKADLYGAYAKAMKEQNLPWPMVTGPLDVMSQDQLAWAQLQAINSILGTQLIEYALTLPADMAYADRLAAIQQKSESLIAAIPATQLAQTMCTTANGTYDSNSGGCSWADEKSCMAAFAHGPFPTTWNPAKKLCYISAAAAAKDACDKQNLQWDFENEVCILSGPYCAGRMGKAAKNNPAYPPNPPGAVDCYETTAQAFASGLVGTTLTGIISGQINKDNNTNGESLQPAPGTVAYTPAAAPAWLAQAPAALYYWQLASLGDTVPAWPDAPGPQTTPSPGNYKVVASRSGTPCNTVMGVLSYAAGFSSQVLLYSQTTSTPSTWTVVLAPLETDIYNIVMGSFNALLGCSTTGPGAGTCAVNLQGSDDPDGSTTRWAFHSFNGGVAIRNQQPGSGMFLSYNACNDDGVYMSSTPCAWALQAVAGAVSQQSTSISFSTGTKPVTIQGGMA